MSWNKGIHFAVIFTLANKLQVLGDEFDRNITIKQWLFMVSVSKFNTPPTISEVAHFIGYSRQNAKRIAVDLHKNGYVTILKDKNDARALRIELTPKCMEYFKKRDLREIEFLENIFTGFDADMTQSVFEGLIRLEQNIEALMTLERE
jgi:DNA-binding MarR family transcriptional regulator